jgi:hypothetical protein
MAAPILLLVAALGALVYAVKLSVDMYNKEAKAAEAAADMAIAAGEAFETAKEKYDEFKSSMTGYDEAVAGLNKLTKGTLEYKE